MIAGKSATSRSVVVGALGGVQILAWGSTFYLPAVLVAPVVADAGWPLTWVSGGLSAALFVAALVSPAVSRHLAARGGRDVLAASAVLIGAGLALLGAAPNFWVFLLGWLVIGAGMGAGLYDAAFATLSELYGQSARREITTLTLYGGFASTLCWPLSAALVEHTGWRGACFAYAALQICVSLPAILLVVPHGRATTPTSRASDEVDDRPAPRSTLLVLSVALAVSAIVSSIVAVQLLTLLQGQGASLSTAVALGMIIGPAQVGARVIEMFIGNRWHPVMTMLAAALLMAAGLALMMAGLSFIAVALVLYAAGNGVWSITRGSVPLALLGGHGYARNMGRLVRPALMASAAAPFIAGVLYEQGGAALSQQALVALALVNVAAVAALAVSAKQPRTG